MTTARRVSLILITFLVFGSCVAHCVKSGEADSLTSLSQSLEKVISKVRPAVVTIEVAAYVHPDDDDGRSANPHDRQHLTRSHAIGSGVIVDDRGYIVTNAHVVEGATALRVSLDETLRSSRATETLNLGSLTFDGRVVGVFEQADLAVVKIDAPKLPTIRFGNSDAVRPGQLVFAVGSPEGLKNSVSVGVVSGVERDSGTDEGATFIQTDVALNPGSSGGALVDTNGELIGINSFVMTDGHGSNQRLGFALPSKLVRSVFEELKNNGRVAYGDIGIRVQTVTPILAHGLPISQDWGIIVSDVIPGSTAEAAGIEIQDLILAVDGQPLTLVPQLAVLLYGKHIGDRLQLDLLRGSQHLSRIVMIAERAPAPDSSPPSDVLARGLIAKLGIICSAITQLESANRKLRSAVGLLVIAKLNEGDIDNDLLSGDVIRSINGLAITNIEDLRSELEHLRPGNSAVLHIERQHHFEYLALEID